MAKQEQDREDLLKDGKQMGLRAECSIDGVVFVIGFRSQGQVSIYVGSDPVFQFNSSVELRRVFSHGKRYAAIQGRLCELVRSGVSDRLGFVTQAVPDDVETAIVATLELSLARIQGALEGPEADWRLVGGDFAEFQSQLSAWIVRVLSHVRIAETPHV